ncbi:MAG: N-acetyl-gamma-glutamyl-phosphate reductase [Clostridiales bacterium]|nr:N-acetyl-gamma-glutamyl-phosphate reductase [Clostridiales bacterium]
MYKVFIDGNQGTTGLRLYDRLSKRTDIELLKISDELRKDKEERRRLINSSDITFLCLPDAASRESVSLCDNENTVIIDASTAHRTEKGWAYGFPELSPEYRSAIETSKRIAVPGCHASGFISIVYPLIKSGIMPADYPCVCHSLTGYSGGGRKMADQYENDKTEDLFAPRQYGLNQNHKHLKEMKYITGLDAAPLFTPIVDDYYSGMSTTVPLYTKLLNGASIYDVYGMFCEQYNNSAVVSTIPFEGGTDNPVTMISANALSGSDSMKIFISGNEERIFITSIFDNLGKGASGAAVQCMNISMGIDETTSLVL